MVNYRYHISPRIYLIGGNTEMGRGKIYRKGWKEGVN